VKYFGLCENPSPSFEEGRVVGGVEYGGRYLFNVAHLNPRFCKGWRYSSHYIGIDLEDNTTGEGDAGLVGMV
jgi:hypothetical protein